MMWICLPEIRFFLKTEPRSLDVASPEEEGELDFDDGKRVMRNISTHGRHSDLFRQNRDLPILSSTLPRMTTVTTITTTPIWCPA